MRLASTDNVAIQRLALALTASACVLSGCGHASHERIVRCEWHGTGSFAKYATQAEAKMMDDRLIALRIASTVDTIPDSMAGTCAYELPQVRIEFISDDAFNKRLRLVDDRSQGIGYVHYRVTGDRLIVESIDAIACEAGRIELPIDMGQSAGDCRVGRLGMR
jgi:hypothetical protein